MNHLELKKDAILAKKIPLPRNTAISGVIFLIDKNDIVFIGHSKDVVGNVLKHIDTNKKQFDSYAFIEVPEEKLSDVAAHYMTIFNPRYNISLPKNTKYHSLNTIKNKFGINMNVLNVYMNYKKIEKGLPSYEDEQFHELKYFMAWASKNYPKIEPEKYSVKHIREYIDIRTPDEIPF